MSKLNLLVHINAYKDKTPTNNPTKSHFKWTLDSQSSEINEPESKEIELKAGETLELFSGLINISDDNTTTYDLALKAGTSNTYRLSYNSGTAPEFRAQRTTGADATTEVSVSINGPLMKLESTGGTPFNIVANVGDTVRIGSAFNIANQGKFKILSLDATSITVENSVSVVENSIVLANFADDVNIYSTDGIQVGEEAIISSGFNSLTFGSYEITDVNPEYIEIYSIKSLAEEISINTQVQIRNSSKSFIYIESDKSLSISIDGSDGGTVDPLTCGTKINKGVYLKTGKSFAASITNKSQDVASVFYALGE